jgi:hypothetical protein
MAQGQRLYLTPKGWLGKDLSDKFGASLEESEEIWESLRKFVEQTALSEGRAGEVPALIFVGGGECTMATKKQEKKSNG